MFLDAIRRHVAVDMAGYLAERRYQEKQPGPSRRHDAREGMTGDLRSVVHAHPFLGAWSERAAPLTSVLEMTPQRWDAFLCEHALLAGRILRRNWATVQEISYELAFADADGYPLCGRMLRRLLAPVRLVGLPLSRVLIVDTPPSPL